MNTVSDDTCPVCGGRKSPGEATFTADYGLGVVVVRHVPAMVCDQCGEEWLSAHVVRQLESFVDRARAAKREVEVVGYSACV